MFFLICAYTEKCIYMVYIHYDAYTISHNITHVVKQISKLNVSELDDS